MAFAPYKSKLAAITLILLTAAGCAHPNYQQVWMNSHAGQMQYAQGYSTIGFNPAIFTIPGRPFTAARTYAEWPHDGSPDSPTKTSTFTIARDSRGRIHYENSRGPGEVSVIISDPIAHTQVRYTLSHHASGDKLARRCTEPLMRDIAHPGDAELNPAHRPSLFQLASYTPPRQDAPVPAGRQDLGTRTIEGIAAFGERTVQHNSTKYGQQTLVQEQWFSPDLGLNLIDIKDFSGQPINSVRTHDIQFVEPDPRLFDLPPGYTLAPEVKSCVGG